MWWDIYADAENDAALIYFRYKTDACLWYGLCGTEKEDSK